MQVEKHEGMLEAQHSFLETQATNVIVTSLKKAEDGDGLILRFYEWAGTNDAKVQFLLPTGVRSAEETNLMEKPIGTVPLRGSEIIVNTQPYEIKTIRLHYPDLGEAHP